MKVPTSDNASAIKRLRNGRTRSGDHRLRESTERSCGPGRSTPALTSTCATPLYHPRSRPDYTRLVAPRQLEDVIDRSPGRENQAAIAAESPSLAAMRTSAGS